MSKTEQILAKHPAPWSFGPHGPPGNIVMVDAANKIVELFDVLDFAVESSKNSLLQPSPASASA